MSTKPNPAVVAVIEKVVKLKLERWENLKRWVRGYKEQGREIPKELLYLIEDEDEH